MKITFQGKEIEVKQVQPGVVQKTDSIYYVQDCVSKEWLYCFPKRLEALNKKHNGDLSGYMGRESKAKMREEARAAKAANKVAKAEKPEMAVA